MLHLFFSFFRVTHVRTQLKATQFQGLWVCLKSQIGPLDRVSVHGNVCTYTPHHTTQHTTHKHRKKIINSTNGVKTGTHPARLQTFSEIYIRGLCYSEMLRDGSRYSVTDVSGQPIGFINKGQAVQCWSSWTLKMRQTGCPETSVNNCQPTPCNVPEGEVSDIGTSREEPTLPRNIKYCTENDEEMLF